MMSEKRINPTDAELAILQVLWDNGPCSVRFVNEKLSTDKEIGYTTTLKLMQIMNEKGLTTRDTSSRTHIYKAAIKENLIKNNLLSTFIKATFKGSTAQLVMQALGNHKTSPEELEEIKEMIKNLENHSS